LKLQRLFQDAFALEISKDVIQRAPQSLADFTYRGYQPRAYAAALRYFMKIMDNLADHPIGINAFVGGAAADLYGLCLPGGPATGAGSREPSCYSARVK
jgi:hypothetical protein